jgi:hypothetical protein
MGKTQNMDTEYLGVIWDIRHSHSLLVGMQNGTASLEDNSVSYKTKHILTT